MAISIGFRETNWCVLLDRAPRQLGNENAAQAYLRSDSYSRLRNLRSNLHCRCGSGLDIHWAGTGQYHLARMEVK